MQATKIVSGVVKLWILAMAAGALYFLWAQRAKPPLENDIEQAENIARTNVDVRIGSIQKMPLSGYTIGYGTVEPQPATAANPSADARITVSWPAAVSEVRCIEGQLVEKGDPLFVALAASAPTAEEIKSPIAGAVVTINIHRGEVALPTQTAIEVIDLNRLVIATQIPAWQAKEVALGQSASVEIPADGASSNATKFNSTVERIDPSADPKTNLVSIDITAPPKLPIRPGQLARVSIETSKLENCLAVPADAIVRDELDRPFLGIVSDDRKQATLRPITPGIRDGDWVQVTGEGISAGQTIVVQGAYALAYRDDINVLNP
jgi:membrane fusion protein (multidrug efflux system)